MQSFDPTAALSRIRSQKDPSFTSQGLLPQGGSSAFRAPNQSDRSKSPLNKYRDQRDIPGRLMTKDLIELYKQCPDTKRPTLDV